MSFRNVDDQLLILSNQRNCPQVFQLKKDRENLNNLLSDLELAISHKKLGEMAKTFKQAC